MGLFSGLNQTHILNLQKEHLAGYLKSQLLTKYSMDN